MGDNIRELPIDTVPPTHDEKEMIHWMFPVKEKQQQQEPVHQQQHVTTSQSEMTSKFHFELKSLTIVILMYIALSNPWTDSIFNKALPITTNSSVILTICKSIVFAILLLLFFNIFYKYN
jgi:hypothetical protein